MDDDIMITADKRSETMCTRVTERMALDVLREASKQDRKVSDWLFLLIRRELYERLDGQSTNTSS